MKYLLLLLLPVAVWAGEDAEATVSVEIVTDVGGMLPDGGPIGTPNSVDEGTANYE